MNSVGIGRGNAASDPMQAALKLLARRALPVARVRDSLAKAFDAETAERTVARLLELKVLDDRAFAAAFVRDRFARAGYGRERIRAELRARGVAAGEVEAAVAAAIDPLRERESAERALQRFRRLRQRARARNDDARKLREAAFRHLIGRGFPPEVVRELLGASEIEERPARRRLVK